MDQFRALRSGSFPVVSLNHVEGLITFPSVHTSWALLMTWGFRQNRWLFPPLLLLYLAVVGATLTTGWQYESDVFGGVVVAVLVVILSRGGWIRCLTATVR